MPPPFDLLPTLWSGMRTTIELTLVSAALALVVAIIAGAMRSSENPLISGISGVYVEIFRGTSVVVQLFWVFFVLPLFPEPFNVDLTPFAAGVIAFGLNLGAYGAEVVRGAINAVPAGQTEAAIALNFTPIQRMTRIILPQAMVRIIPPFGNLLIELLKATALAGLINVQDVTYKALTLRQSVGRTTEVFILVLVLYFLIAYPLTLGVRWFERRRAWAL